MAFSWTHGAIPSLMIGLLLCGLFAGLWRRRRRGADRSIAEREVGANDREQRERRCESVRVDLLLEVADAVSAAPSVDGVLRAGLEAVGRCMGWPVGHVYRPFGTDRPELRSAGLDRIPDGGRFDELCATVAATGLAPRDGAPGRAWWTQEVEIDVDLGSGPGHPRDAVACELGLGAALAVPVREGREIVAVLEFLAPSMLDVDARTKRILKHLGEWLGGAIAGLRTDREARGLSSFDGLTGLPSREVFRQRVQAALDAASERERNLAVLFVDVDGFRQVNETLGHGAGDDVLREIARRFHKLTRPDDIVSRGDRTGAAVSLSRPGGDEFLLFLDGIDSAEDASRVAARLVAGLYEPIVVDGQEVLVGASVGIAIHPDDGSDAESLIRAADVAMVKAKSQGGNVYRFHGETLNHLSTRHLQLEQRLRVAAENEDWQLHYQPVRNVTTGRVGAVEALLRWDYPELGMVTPDEFLGVAEEIGLSALIGDWVLREACLQAVRWRDSGFEGIRISVNVSARQLLEGDVAASVAAALRAAGTSGEQLEIEIAESAIACDAERIRDIAREIRDLGVAVALDGFGTLPSSLENLRSIRVDRIKIDRSLAASMESDAPQTSAVRGLTGAARELGIGVVAEGVESENELRLLRAAGCEELQGYLFSKPLPSDQVTRFFDREKAGD